MEPEQLLAMPSVQASGAEAVAGHRNSGTISNHKLARTIDFFLFTSRLRRVTRTPEVLVGIPCPPHRPVRLVTTDRPEEPMVQLTRC